ncbi:MULTISPECIES: hypothetical protein [Shewanella]|uniref:hypothetical protein n=1 Tax=Shewanella TaxID=22 RepID=UPI00057B1428|nr:hypothetical protein [Shewanella sp. ECSMB14102]
MAESSLEFKLAAHIDLFKGKEGPLERVYRRQAFYIAIVVSAISALGTMLCRPGTDLTEMQTFGEG